MTTFSPDPLVGDTGMLLRELNHRIDEQFAFAISLISVEAVRAEGAEAKAVLCNTVELLRGYAGVHRTLTMPQCRTLVYAAKYLLKLCRALRGASLDRLSIKLSLKGDSLPLEPERCWRLGLIVHELVTNATKHACFDGRSGEIKVKLARTDWLVNCVVSDNGSAATGVGDWQGQGVRIVGNLARRLGGRIEHGIADDFRSVVLSFPVSDRERHANRVIDSRARRPSRQVKTIASGVAAERGANSFDQDSRPITAVSVADPNPTSARGCADARCYRDALGELLSPSHCTDLS